MYICIYICYVYIILIVIFLKFLFSFLRLLWLLLLSRSTIVHLLSSTSALIRSRSARLCQAAADSAHQCHQRGARFPEGPRVQPGPGHFPNGSTHQLRMKITPDVSASTEPAPETHGTPGNPRNPRKGSGNKWNSAWAKQRNICKWADFKVWEYQEELRTTQNNSEQLTSKYTSRYAWRYSASPRTIKDSTNPFRLIFRGPCSFRAVLLEKLRLQVDEALAVKLAPQSSFPHLQLWSEFCSRFCRVFSTVSAVVSSFCGICRFRSDFIDFYTVPYFPVVLLSLLWLMLFVELGFRSQERDPAAAGASYGPQHSKNSEMLRCQNAKLPCFF